MARGKLNVCYMKGRNNYLCRKKLYDLTDQPMLSGLEEIEHYRAIAAWEKTTQTGDRAELASLPEASALWHKTGRARRYLPGAEVQRLGPLLHHRNASASAMESDIIIVNHHLFFADLAHQAAGGVCARCRNSAGCRGGDFRRRPRTGRCGRKLLRGIGQQWALRGPVPRCGRLAAAQPYAVGFALWRGEEPARAAHCSSSPCCRRAKAVSPSKAGASFWKKTATSFWACNRRCTRLASELENMRRSRKRSLTSPGARRNCRCSSAS